MKVTKDMIHPELRPHGILIRRYFSFKSNRTFERTQQLVRKAKRFMRPRGIVSRQVMLTTKGNQPLRLCVYSSKNPKPGAVGLLWMHGGGYAIGTPEQDIGFIERFINATNCIVISPDYTLSTAAPYPAAIKDCYAALLWMQRNANKLGIDSKRLFVGGESAGGGLAAALSMLARDTGRVSIAFQMPLYPMLDDRMLTPSSKDNDAPVWDSRANEIAWKKYLGNLWQTKDVPVYAAPARATNYKDLPPAYTFVGSIDPFHDEACAYIQNLQDAGVAASIDRYPGCFHAFDIIGGAAPISKRATQNYMKQFLYAATHYTALQPEPPLKTDTADGTRPHHEVV